MPSRRTSSTGRTRASSAMVWPCSFFRSFLVLMCGIFISGEKGCGTLAVGQRAPPFHSWVVRRSTTPVVHVHLHLQRCSRAGTRPCLQTASRRTRGERRPFESVVCGDASRSIPAFFYVAVDLKEGGNAIDCAGDATLERNECRDHDCCDHCQDDAVLSHRLTFLDRKPSAEVSNQIRERHD